MTWLWEVPLPLYHLLAGALFSAGVMQLFLCIYQITAKGIKRCLPDCGIFLLVFCACVFLSANDSLGHLIFHIPVPWLTVPLAALAVAVYACVRVLLEQRRRKNRISPASIKEALDNLGSGILFSNESGRVMLMNYKMAHFCFSAAGIYPRTLQELTPVIETLECVDSERGLYRTRDGRVWHYQSTGLREPSLRDYMQVTVQEVTVLYDANALLERENEQLRRTNEEIAAMLERLADRIREQEILALKTQIHNDIGMSLIALSKLAASGEQRDVDTQINVLENAVGYFSNNRVLAAHEDMESVRLYARELGVTLEVHGTVAVFEELVAAAAEECVTNCVNHAGGDAVFVDIEQAGKEQVVRITNNGKIPDKPIRESGGLSSLRRQVEGRSGKMEITHMPRFVLTIRIYQTGEEYD